MSRRLILGFVLVSLGISIGMGLLRAWTLTGDVRELESDHLTSQLSVVGEAGGGGRADGEGVRWGEHTS